MRTKLSIALIAAGITSVITAGAVSATVLMQRDTPRAGTEVSGTTAPAAATAAEPVAEPVVATAPRTATVPPAALPKAAPTKAAPPKVPAKAAAAKAPAVKAPITYVVKRGDDLSSIAAWFALHGYGELFEANRAVIGDNPDLILPGQRITIAGTTLTMR